MIPKKINTATAIVLAGLIIMLLMLTRLALLRMIVSRNSIMRRGSSSTAMDGDNDAPAEDAGEDEELRQDKNKEQ